MCGGENFERLGEYHIGMVAGSGEGWVGAVGVGRASRHSIGRIVGWSVECFCR